MVIVVVVVVMMVVWNRTNGQQQTDSPRSSLAEELHVFCSYYNRREEDNYEEMKADK